MSIEDNLPTPNIPLLRKAVEWAESEAAKTDGTCLWNQAEYVIDRGECGTAYCIAGFAVVNGVASAEVDAWGLLEVDGRPRHWHTAGREVLGLSDDEADDLFADSNSITDVREVAEQIAGRAGERL